MDEPQSAASQPWLFGGRAWIWTINYWPEAASNHARLNNAWRLHEIEPVTGESLWRSPPVKLAEWTGWAGPLDFAQGSGEPIRRLDIDGQSHTKTPILQSGSLCLFAPTHQGALLCWDLAADPPVEKWRIDRRIKGDDDSQEFLLPLGVDEEGRFICAWRRATWRYTNEDHYVWPNGWRPGDDGETVNASIELPDGAPCGIVALDPVTGAEVWRWEVPETGTWREWERRTVGGYTTLQMESVDTLWEPGTSAPYRRPALALIDPPPLEHALGDYQMGVLVVSGPARYYGPPVSGVRPHLGNGPGTLIWQHVTRGVVDGYPYGSWIGDSLQLAPSLDVVDSLELRSEGDGPASWEVTWHSVYWDQQPVAAEGGSPPHSLTSCAIGAGGIVLGPLSHRDGLDHTMRPMVWRLVGNDGALLWTRSIAAYGEGYGHKCSAPLLVGEQIFTVVWEYVIWDSLTRQPPEMVVLDAATGVVVRRNPVALDVWDSSAVELVRVGSELVSDGQRIWVSIGPKMMRYQ